MIGSLKGYAKNEIMNSIICIDASFVLRTLLPGSYSDQALNLFEKWEQEKRTLIAPALLAFEVISSLRRILYLKELTTHESEEVFERFLRMDIRLSSRRSIFPLAWSLAKEFNRPRAYDSAYLALASLADCDFWTADERLYNAVKDRLPWVKWIGSSSLV